MKNYLIMFLNIITLLTFSFSCKKEKVDTEAIRPIVEFITTDIPTFNGMTQTHVGEIPRGVTKIVYDYYSAEYEFRWTSEYKDYAYFDIRVMQYPEHAIEALTEMHKYYSNPFTDQSIDKPAAVGNISYLQGREFIRDNLIVKIHTSDKFDNLVTEIANYIDLKILKSQSFNSISYAVPIIKNFKINKNPVVEQSQTPLTIQIENPNDKEIVYQWRFDEDRGACGISKDSSGIYYFNSGWLDSTKNNIGLTLIAINEYGFCADSTIYIHIANK
jgi:hypothetical protein